MPAAHLVKEVQISSGFSHGGWLVLSGAESEKGMGSSYSFLSICDATSECSLCVFLQRWHWICIKLVLGRCSGRRSFIDVFALSLGTGFYCGFCSPLWRFVSMRTRGSSWWQSPSFCCCLGEANGQLSCDALPDVRKMTLLGVFVIFLLVKGVVVSSSVLLCTVVVLI